MFHFSEFQNQPRKGNVSPASIREGLFQKERITVEIQEIIIQAAITAPSGDNGQPWKFCWLNSTTLEIELDQSKLKGLLEESQIAPFLSLGAVIQNIQISAAVHGFDILYQWEASRIFIEFINHKNHQDKSPKRQDEIKISSALDALFLRQTNRHPFQEKPLDESMLENLKATALSAFGHDEIFFSSIHPRKDVKIKFRSGSFIRKQTSRICAQAEAVRFGNKRMHNEFQPKVHYGSQAKTATEGLAVHTLGISSFEIFIMRLLRPWKAMRFFTLFQIHKLMAAKIAKLVKTAPTLGAISVRNTHPETLIEAGRLMQSVWITATQFELAFQPSMTFQYLVQQSLNLSPDLTSSDRMKILNCRSQFRELWNLHGTEELVFFFRIGFPIQITPKSPRQSVENFIYSHP